MQHIAPEQLAEIEAVASALRTRLEARKERNKLRYFRPYAKQEEFYAAGLTFRERLLMAANQVGKTYAGSMEAAMHLTGRYPDWWQGHRFDRAITMWAGSDTTETTRDTVQRLLVGPPANEDAWGTGAIPAECILGTQRRQGVANALDTVRVKHASGGTSILGFKSYDQGRQKWQGTTLDFIWLDEEPPQDIYTEALTRTNAVDDARLAITFTPLLGMSEVVRMFLDADGEGGRGVVRMTIDDAEHISPERRAEIIASYPEHEREARTKGIPALGSGRVYPVSEATITVEPFPVPEYWPVIGGLDFGWDHPTAAVKLAWDRDSDVVYVVAAYRRKQATPIEHAAALRPWGSSLLWAWPHDGHQPSKGKFGGASLWTVYAEAGLRMMRKHSTHPDGGYGVEPGILALLERMQSGRLKVFLHLSEWLDEFRYYHRKEGLIVKERDDLMDATRVAFMSLRSAEPSSWGHPDDWEDDRNDGRNEVTGY